MSQITYPRGCKYNPDCGVFKSPREIGAHYATAHEGHVKKHKPRVKSAELAVVEPGAGKAVKARRLPHADDICVPVVLTIANGHPMTSEQLEAVFHWRDATTALLAAFGAR